MPSAFKRRQISGDSLRHRPPSVDEIFIEAGKMILHHIVSISIDEQVTQ